MTSKACDFLNITEFSIIAIRYHIFWNFPKMWYLKKLQFLYLKIKYVNVFSSSETSTSKFKLLTLLKLNPVKGYKITYKRASNGKCTIKWMKMKFKSLKHYIKTKFNPCLHFSFKAFLISYFTYSAFSCTQFKVCQHYDFTCRGLWRCRKFESTQTWIFK